MIFSTGKGIVMDNNSILTPEEQQVLEQTRQYREKILARAFEHGAPEKASDIEAVNTVLSAMDKSVYDAANTRLKHQDSQNATVLLDTIAEAIKMAQTAKNEQIVLNETQRQLTLPEELKVTDIVPGELGTEHVELNPEDFVKGD